MQSRKTCTKCGEEKSLEDFHKDSSKKLGVGSICRDCKNAQKRKRQSINRNEVLRKKRRYRALHRTLDLEEKDRYRERNRAALREENRIYRKELKDLTKSFSTVPRHSRFSAEEDLILIQDDGKTVYQKAIELGRTHDACLTRIKRLKKGLHHDSA